MEKLSFMEIIDMNQLLLSKYLCDFNQMLGNIKSDWFKVFSLVLIFMGLTLHSWR